MPPDEKDNPPVEPPAVASSNPGSNTSQAGMTEQEQAADAALVKSLFQTWPPISPVPEESDLTRLEEAVLAAAREGRPLIDEGMTEEEKLNAELLSCMYGDLWEKERMRVAQASKARPPEPKKK